jgi:hypothetical protein
VAKITRLIFEYLWIQIHRLGYRANCVLVAGYLLKILILNTARFKGIHHATVCTFWLSTCLANTLMDAFPNLFLTEPIVQLSMSVEIMQAKTQWWRAQQH